nr:unnamed protein product [Trichobilharzia regenti]
MWWMGFILMGIGEFANFVAYAFAPAILVTPLGALSVLVSTLLSVRYLNEHLNCISGIGCCICLLGSTLVVLHAPKEQNLTSLQEMLTRATYPSFIVYGVFVIILSGILIFILGPRYGKTNPIVFTLISGSIGSLSVIACKGVGVGLKDAFTTGLLPILSFWFFWFLIIWLICAITIQMYYLNRALDLFNTGVITPLLYVFFTGFVIIASAILFRELNVLDYMDYIGLILGLLCTVLGIFMITVLKDLSLTWTSLRTILSGGKYSAYYSSSNGSLTNGHVKQSHRRRRTAAGSILQRKSSIVRATTKTLHCRHLSIDKLSAEKLISSNHYSDTEQADSEVLLLPTINDNCNDNNNSHSSHVLSESDISVSRLRTPLDSPRSCTSMNNGASTGTTPTASNTTTMTTTSTIAKYPITRNNNSGSNSLRQSKQDLLNI